MEVRCSEHPDKLRFKKNAKGRKEAARYVQKLQQRSTHDDKPFPSTWYTCGYCGGLHLTTDRQRKKRKREKVA